MRLLLCGLVVVTVAIIAACRVAQQPPQAASAAAAPTPTAVSAARKAAEPTNCETLTPNSDSQFPANFDYPQAGTTIQTWVKERRGGRERLHAYCVFAGLNQLWQGTATPTWATWKTSTQAFPNQYNPWPLQTSTNTPAATQDKGPVTLIEARAQEAVGPIVNPPPKYYVNPAVASNPAYSDCLVPAPGEHNQYTLIDGTVFQSNGDIMVAAVPYNEAALEYIIDNKLYNAVTLNQKLPANATDPPKSIPEFPADSMVLKVMLWPVSGGTPSATALPYWDWDAHTPGSSADNQYAGYEMQKFWTEAVAITGSGGTGTTQAQFLYGVRDSSDEKPLGPHTYSAQVVGLDRLYHRTYTAGDLAALSPCDRAILDASAYWNYNRAFQAGDSLALIAMHIMTKEQSDWTFQSAWWHPNARDCTVNTRFCGNRPSSVPGGDTTWKNYMMTSTYGMHQRPNDHRTNYYAPPDTKTPPHLWPVAYNPYIELAASHPITTNCMNCHHRAAWPPNFNLFQDLKPDLNRFSAYLQLSPPNPVNPNALEVFDSTNGVFNGLLMLDSMWAVSDRAGYPAPPAKSAEKRK